MAKKYLIFFPFFFLCALLTLGVLRESGLFGAGELGAGGFGVSPPVLRLAGAAAGESRGGTVTLLRNTLAPAETVSLSLDDREMPGWLSLSPGPDLVFGENDFQLPFRVLVSLPANARPGEYRGAVNARYGKAKKGLVAIGLGARIDVIVSVAAPSDRAAAVGPLSRPAASPLYDRLKGRFVLKAQDRGQLWYLGPRQGRAVYLDSADRFWAYLENEARAVSPALLSLMAGESAAAADGGRYGMEASVADLAKALAGDFLESPEARGAYWYVEPGQLALYGFTGPAQAWDLARRHATGMTNADFDKLFK